MSEKALQVESLWSGLIDTNGDPLAGGKVYTYEAGTTTNKTMWTDADKGTPAANPIILDSEGKAAIYADGNYKLRIDNSADVTQLTIDEVSYRHNEFLSSTFVDPREYGDGSLTDDTISTAITGLAGANRTMLIASGTWVIDADLTIPENIELFVMEGANFSVSTTKTLTINGPMRAPISQIFTESGTAAIAFGPTHIRAVYPEWWGAVGDDSTDNADAIQNALNALPTSDPTGGTIRFSDGHYRIGSTITVDTDGVSIEGENRNATRLDFTGSGIGLLCQKSRVSVKHLMIGAKGTSSITKVLTYNVDASTITQGRIEDVHVYGGSVASIVGINLQGKAAVGGVYNCTLDTVFVEDCAVAVRFDTSSGTLATFKCGTHVLSNVVCSGNATGILMDAVKNITLLDCDVESNTAYGYDLTETADVAWLGCWCGSNGGDTGAENIRIQSTVSDLSYLGGHLSDAGNSLDTDLIRIGGSELAVMPKADDDGVRLHVGGGIKTWRASVADPYFNLTRQSGHGWSFEDASGEYLKVDTTSSTDEIAAKLKKHQSGRVWNTGATGTSTDSGTSTLFTFTLTDNKTYSVWAHVEGHVDGAGGNRGAYILHGLFYRNGGAAVQVGATTVISSIESDAAWDCVLNESGNTVVIVVNGKAADGAISWTADVDVIVEEA